MHALPPPHRPLHWPALQLARLSAPPPPPPPRQCEAPPAVQPNVPASRRHSSTGLLGTSHQNCSFPDFAQNLCSSYPSSCPPPATVPRSTCHPQAAVPAGSTPRTLLALALAPTCPCRRAGPPSVQQTPIFTLRSGGGACPAPPAPVLHPLSPPIHPLHHSCAAAPYIRPERVLHAVS